MDVSIIIVNYNTKHLLEDCLSSLYALTQSIDFEVIVVDNASSDDSETYITRKFPQVKWINSGGNIGFGRANNLGAKYADGKYLLLLNSDTLLLNNAIKAFYDYAETHSEEQIGALGGWLVDSNHNSNSSYGYFPSPCAEIQYLLQNCILKKKLHHEIEMNVDYIIGADMFVLKKVFEELGGFDSNFFMYYEETDLQYRMAQNGYVRRIIVTPHIVHLEGGSFSIKGLTLSRFIMAQKSYNYYLRKHYKGIKYAVYKTILCLLRLTLFVTTRWTVSEKIKAYYLVLSGK